MSPGQWNTYCYHFNYLNDMPQPEKLVKDVQAYNNEIARKKRIQDEELNARRWKRSIPGRVFNTLFYYMFLQVPLMLAIWLYEDTTNPESIRKPMYQTWINMPTVNEFFMFEIQNIGKMQDMDRKDRGKKKKKKLPKKPAGEYDTDPSGD